MRVQFRKPKPVTHPAILRRFGRAFQQLDGVLASGHVVASGDAGVLVLFDAPAFDALAAVLSEMEDLEDCGDDEPSVGSDDREDDPADPERRSGLLDTSDDEPSLGAANPQTKGGRWLVDQRQWSAGPRGLAALWTDRECEPEFERAQEDC